MGRKRFLFPARAKSDEHATVETFWIKTGEKTGNRKTETEETKRELEMGERRITNRQNDRRIEIFAFD